MAAISAYCNPDSFTTLSIKTVIAEACIFSVFVSSINNDFPFTDRATEQTEVAVSMLSMFNASSKVESSIIFYMDNF